MNKIETKLEDIFSDLESNKPSHRYVFTETFKVNAFKQAKETSTIDRELSGLIISVKDLFDIKGHLTRAGSRIFEQEDKASQDAFAVQRLKQAGGIIIGKTNMTELAYSGLGLNPHFGTADNPLYPGHIPGGSTSGGAVSVAIKAADIALGTDTGGSVRIPAAFTGLVGFKPSQQSVPRQGLRALSQQLDSIGPIANTVAECKLSWRVLSNTKGITSIAAEASLIVPTNFGTDDLSPEIETGFNALVETLKSKDWHIEHKKLDFLEQYKQLPVWHFSSIESRANYDPLYQKHADLIDPRVRSRMARADEVSALEYCQTLYKRQAIIEQANKELGDQFLLMPTVAMLPPSFKLITSDEAFYNLNLRALRNTSVANVINGCSISLPFKHQQYTQGAMLTAINDTDVALLNIASKLEHDLTQSNLRA